jgi:hypothetical protein
MISAVRSASSIILAAARVLVKYCVKRFLLTRRPIRWLAYLGGWTLFALFFISQDAGRVLYQGRKVEWHGYLVVWLTTAFAWACLAPLVWRLSGRFPIAKSAWWRNGGIHVVSTVAGRQAALDGGVDVFAHTPDPSGADNGEMLQVLKTRGIAVIPTLKLWGVDTAPEQRERAVANGVFQIRAFNAIGGTILFGSDVGYMDDTDPTEEYRLMSRAGMSFQQILASLTTTPARLFGAADTRGRVSRGYDADLVFLGANPSADITAFANVKRVLLRGRVLLDQTTGGH